MRRHFLKFLSESIPGAVSAAGGPGAYTVDIGDGPRAVTEAELLVAHKAYRIADIREQANERVVGKYPPWRQRSAALGVYPQAYVSQMQADIAAVIEASNSAEDAVTAAADAAAVDAVTPNWPVI